MTNNPSRSREISGAPQKKRAGCFVLVVICFVAMLATLFYGRPLAYEAANRMQCNNNLKQIALALQAYEADRGALPPAYTVDANGRPLHSWRTLILPFMEHQKLFDTIDLSKPWDDPVNKAAFDTSVHTYHCPSAAGSWTETSYFALVGSDRCFHPTQARKLAEITDDHGLTLMLVEGHASQAVHWMSPVDVEPTILSNGVDSPLPHTVGANAVTFDGRIFVFNAETSAEKFRALVSIHGNDDAIAGQVNRQ